MQEPQRSIDLRELAHHESWTWPEDAADIVIATLRDPTASEEERCLAAEMAGDSVLVGEPIVENLLAVLRDTSESPLLRGRAAISLGPVLEELDLLFPDPFDEDPPVSDATAREIRDTLQEIYRDAEAPKEVRRRALEASVRMSETWHADVVRAAFHSGDEDWRLTAVFCMRFVRGFDDEIVAALDEDAASSVFYEAVRAAGEFGVARAWRRVRAILDSDTDDKVLLIAAIEAAASIHPDRAREVLEPFLDDDDEDIVATARSAISIASAEDAFDDFADDE
jgi:HEAT repeat protein